MMFHSCNLLARSKDDHISSDTGGFLSLDELKIYKTSYLYEDVSISRCGFLPHI